MKKFYLLAVSFVFLLLFTFSCRIYVQPSQDISSADQVTHTTDTDDDGTEPVIIQDSPISSEPVTIDRKPVAKPESEAPGLEIQRRPMAKPVSEKPEDESARRPIPTEESKPIRVAERKPLTAQERAPAQKPISREEIDKPISYSEIKPQEKPNNMIENIVNFSFNMFRHLSEKSVGENMSFSPVSLNIAFAMVYAGAEKETKKEISEAIGFPYNHDEFFSNFGRYHDYLGSLVNDSEIEFNLANRVFLEMTYKILASYQANITKYFEGAFQQMDFLNQPRKSESIINEWVEEMTRNRIRNLLPPGTIEPLTRMVLVNAIYIKSNWKNPFDEKRTEKKPFNKNQRERVELDFMMQKIDGVNYAKVNDKAVLEMKYTTPHLSLLIILPDKSDNNNIHKFSPTLDEYQKILRSLTNREVYMEIPKFKIESDFDLAAPLQNNGIRRAFAGADFSGITGKPDLEISDVIQKVFFEIDEKGSEAAAATAIVMRTTSMAPQHDRPQIVRFIANRPFIFILKENTYNTPLFIGQYVGEKK